MTRITRIYTDFIFCVAKKICVNLRNLAFNQRQKKNISVRNYGNQSVHAELFIDRAGLYFIEVVDNQGHVLVVKQVVE